MLLLWIQERPCLLVQLYAFSFYEKLISKGPSALIYFLFQFCSCPGAYIISFSFFSEVTCGTKLLFADHDYQPIVTEINHAIGAEGIVSAECKEVVTQYGDLIWELLVSGVGCFYVLHLFSYSLVHLQVLLIFMICRYTLTKYVHNLVYVFLMGHRM